MSISNTVLKTILAMKQHPKVYLRGDLSYCTVEAYLNGYLTALGQSYSIDLEKTIKLWFQKKVNEKTSCAFTTHVENYYGNRTEEDRINTLIDLVAEFFQEKPEWYQQGFTPECNGSNNQL
ncbi:MAG: hypothetical protein LBH71_01525 [Oscillospiraceae bacterium]|jgi:hypothetical protein|nr:hypothetical protein [Oscillospiraceae bacterium]